MAKDNTLPEIEGIVTECLPNLMFKVDIGDGDPIACRLSGKLKMNFIRVIRGDKVTVQLSPGMKTGRIIWRTK